MKEFNGVDIAIKILNFDPSAKILLALLLMMRKIF